MDHEAETPTHVSDVAHQTQTYVRDADSPHDAHHDGHQHSNGEGIFENDPVLYNYDEPSSNSSGDTVIRSADSAYLPPHSRGDGFQRGDFSASKEDAFALGVSADDSSNSADYYTGASTTSTPINQGVDNPGFESSFSDGSFVGHVEGNEYFSPQLTEQLEDADVNVDGEATLEDSLRAEADADLKRLLSGSTPEPNTEGITERRPSVSEQKSLIDGVPEWVWKPYVPETQEPEKTHSIVTTTTTTIVRDTDEATAVAKAEEIMAIIEDEVSEWQDVVGNGQLMKRTIHRGKPGTRPERGSEVTVKCSAKILDTALEQGSVLSTVDKHDELKFTIGDTEVIQGLDLAVQLMEVGEIAEMKLEPRFAYGELGSQELSVPSEATLLYTVELLKADAPVELENLGVDDRVRTANYKVDRGNFWYLRKEVILAISLYQRAVNVLEAPNDRYMTPEDVVNMNNAKARAYGNLSSAQVEEKLWDEGLQSVNNSLKYDPNNGKLWIRKVKIFREKGEFDQACDACEEVLQKGALVGEIHMKKARDELGTLRKKKRISDNNEKAMYQRMLGSAPEAARSASFSKPSNGSSRPSPPRSDPGSNRNNSSSKWLLFAGAAAIAVVGGVIGLRYYQQHH